MEQVEARQGREWANQEAERQKAIDLKRLAATRSENRDAWIYFLRRSARTHLRIARDIRRRLRELEDHDPKGEA